MIPLLNKSTANDDVLLEFLNGSTVYCSRFEDGQWYCHVLLVLFTLALPVGILGNVAALVNYACFRKPSSTSHVFLLNLALCDSAWILTLPVTAYFTFHRAHPRGIQIFCQFKKISFNVSIYGSILFLTLISVERYIATAHPVSSLRWWGVGKAKVCSLCTWILIVLGSVPDLFVAFAIRRPENVTVCMDHIHGPFVHVRTLTVIRTVALFLLPFGVMLTLYIMTVCVLRRRARGKHRATQRAGGLITAAVFVFVVSFAPYHAVVIALVVMRLRDQITPSNANVLYALYEFSEALCSVSSCLDPVLYIVASERFQKKLLAFKRGRHKRLCCRVSRRVGVVG